MAQAVLRANLSSKRTRQLGHLACCVDPVHFMPGFSPRLLAAARSGESAAPSLGDAPGDALPCLCPPCLWRRPLAAELPSPLSARRLLPASSGPLSRAPSHSSSSSTASSAAASSSPLRLPLAPPGDANTPSSSRVRSCICCGTEKKPALRSPAVVWQRCSRLRLAAGVTSPPPSPAAAPSSGGLVKVASATARQAVRVPRRKACVSKASSEAAANGLSMSLPRDMNP
mmetsp:Transcript_6036/g.19434  ORF Transcript_6036/g.19434 Transcript_6036/m.19434 type:complete len:228 (+) Transcript_6036:234-917(+)